ncbi:hypothetical protein [Paenibacillus polysaccharolyticus]|uniref:hypothetical protein n=1 Tax=Paenibacillus polysaccharolyticus TaxID=582692 RepID=UPI00300ACF88
MDTSNNFVEKTFDFFSKFIFTLAVAVIGYNVAISSAMLTFLNNNKEEIIKVNEHQWIESNKKIFSTFTDGYELYTSLIISGTILLIIIMNHLFINSLKQSHHKQHLTVIEEVEKELSHK